MPGTLAPSPWFTGLDTNGNPVSNGLLHTYAAGTTTEAVTYQDVDLTVPHANPIELDAAGRCTMYLVPGSSYKFRLEDENGVLIREQDDIPATPGSASAVDEDGIVGEDVTTDDLCYLSDGSGGKTAGRWYKAQADNPYSSTSPLLAYPQTNASAGDTVSLRLTGPVTLTGPLTVGAIYYASAATAGEITNTDPVTNSRKVGQAQSSTVLVMVANPPSPAATSYVNANNILANQVFS